MVDVLEKWAQHRTTDDADQLPWFDDDVAYWGSRAIFWLVTRDTRAPWLAAGAEGVLRGIAADTSGTSNWAKGEARDALKQLGL